MKPTQTDGFGGSIMSSRHSSKTSTTSLHETAMRLRQQNEKVAEKRMMKARYRKGAIDWVPLAKMLASLPTPSVSTAKTDLTISKKALQEYTGSMRPNSWMEPYGAGVKVQVDAGVQVNVGASKGGHRTAVLRGSPGPVEAVRQKYEALETSVTKLESTAPFDGATPGDNLYTVDSIASFTRFVFRLTNRELQRRVERTVVPDYNRYAADLLVCAFSDPVKSTFASTVALNRALSFLNPHFELFDAAKLIYTHGHRMRLVNDVSTMNLRLWRALKWNMADLAMSIVRDMRELSIVPNSHTWSLVYTSLRNADERSEVARLIEKQGIATSARAWSYLALPLLAGHMKTPSQSSDQFAELVGDLNSAFGTDWLSPNTYRQLRHIANRNGSRSLSLVLAQIAEEQFTPSSRSDYVYEFQALRMANKTREAVDLLEKLIGRNEHLDLQLVVPTVFMSAWNTSHVNLVRLLWRFAASRDLVTSTMKFCMLKALLSKDPLPTAEVVLSPSQMRRFLQRRKAAKVAVGISSQDADVVDAISSLSTHFPPDTHRIEMLSKWLPEGPARKAQIHLAHAMIKSDLQAWTRFKPMALSSLAACLHKCLEMDERWRKGGAAESLSVSEMREQAFRVRLGQLDDPERERIETIRRNIMQDLTHYGLKKREEDAGEKHQAASRTEIGSATAVTR